MSSMSSITSISSISPTTVSSQHQYQYQHQSISEKRQIIQNAINNLLTSNLKQTVDKPDLSLVIRCNSQIEIRKQSKVR